MTFRWPIPAKTVAGQHKASAPAHSAWVRANAGSGKTHVLAQRVIRLLLAGNDPSKILCLTFTKAAAANMSLRVFTMLSKWTSMENGALRKALADMGVEDEINLESARRLFARAVETPGGLKIQTIHAFCERILHLFPFEANVPAHFEALDEEKQSLLLAQAREEMLRLATHAPSSEFAKALVSVANEVSGKTFDGLLIQSLSKRSAMRNASLLQTDGYAKALANELGLMPGDTLEKVQSEILEGGLSQKRWDEICMALDGSGANDRKLSQYFRAASNAAGTADRIANYLRIFCTGKGDPRAASKGRFLNKSIDSSVERDYAQEHARICSLLDKLKGARTVALSSALQLVCDEVLNIYARLKQARGYLDFEDLIERASDLLLRTEAAGWVLYKLDAGIDHILVDEAQDTSPAQWTILSALASEFFAGASARSGLRTFFAVGDEKQSIFSFQGARPEEFGRNEKLFRNWVEYAQLKFEIVPLRASFRSAQTILASVDTVFSLPEHYAGLSTDDDVKPVHEAVKSDLPGLVEIWQPVGPQPAAEPPDWRMPLDALPENSPPATLARRIAQKIKEMIEAQSREAVHDGAGDKRKILPGDIMILVRRRDAFFEAIIRALKMANIPVAGADRLKLMEHIAVIDLVAAGRAALLPQDDFTLACVLKSPLFGFDDDDLMKLAPERKSTLMAALQQNGDPRYTEAFERIADWGAAARALGPFRFYARLLNAEGGRRKMLARLGTEAGDAIDEFLRIALQWERTETPSLTSFLHRISAADIEIKRDLEAAGDAVRVMTVHAAKGLESKIVFLPDTCATPGGKFDPDILEIGRDDAKLPIWKRRKQDNPQAVQNAVESHRASQAAEYRRLLYVAMTRAEERLYICGHHGERPPAPQCWYSMIRQTLSEGAVAHPAPWGDGEIFRIGNGATLDGEGSPKELPLPGPVPHWLFTPAETEIAPPPPIRPSRALDAADQLEPAQATEAFLRSDDALLTGTLLHALLQYLPDLPPERRTDAANRFLAARGSRLDIARRHDLVREALAVLADSRLAALFGSGSRAEVAIAGRVAKAGGGDIEISGRIDRLGVTDDAVFIADFKTGTPPAQATAPARYVVQLALYRAALTPLFAGKTVRAFTVWTGGPHIEELDDAMLNRSLASAIL